MEINRVPTFEKGKPLPFAKGMSVRGAQGFVFLNGCTGRGPVAETYPEGLGAQTTLALEEIKRRLEQFGAPLENICHVLWHIVGDFPNGVVDDPKNQERRIAEQEFWKKHCPEFVMGKTPPASTLVVVKALAKPEIVVEITVIAAIP